MPMIDVYAAAGTFADPHQLAVDLAAAVMTIEQVPNIPMFRKNTAAFVHELPPARFQCRRRQQLRPRAGADQRRRAGPRQAARRRAPAHRHRRGGRRRPRLADRTWVLLTEAPEGGWGLAATPTPTPS